MMNWKDEGRRDGRGPFQGFGICLEEVRKTVKNII